MKKIRIVIFILSLVLPGCRKYLDQITQPELAIPADVQGMQRLADNTVFTSNSTPGLGHLGTTDYWYADASWAALSLLVQNASTWQAEINQGDPPHSWHDPYEAIFNANAMLTNLPNVKITGPSDIPAKQALQGTALFMRAFHLFYIEETFGQPYKPATAATDPGVIIRVPSNMYDKVGRSPVQKVYDQMTGDVGQAIPLLPDSLQRSYRNRPCKAAALALLSRIYLSMQQYDSALVYADSSLRYYSRIIDYNSIDTADPHPFSDTGNDEVLFQCSAVAIPGQSAPYAFVDSDLYRSYATDDLRRIVFFRRASSGVGYYMKPGYSGTNYLFSGIAVDETVLTRAECLARLGQKEKAIDVLNGFLLLRYRTGTFQPYTPATADDALRIILEHRRKETLFRESRWIDLRRLSQDARFAVTLQRIVNGQVYTLPPGDRRYTYPIPEQEIQVGGIQQNPR